MTTSNTPRCPFEHIAEKENEQIDEITDITVKLLDKRYTNKGIPILRGVHPKSHGCVRATFKINDAIDENLRVGLFANPGKEFQAILRFSNAAALVAPDIDAEGNHGSRGMAIKVLDVGGDVLLEDRGEHNQDFLMINQPMFAFANTEDYLQLNRALDQFNDNPKPFFKDIPAILDKLQNAPQDLTETDKRILKSAKIVKDIQTTAEDKDANPLEIRYFSAAPFLFGDNNAMKFSAMPIINGKATEFPEQVGENYLREALETTMQGEQDIVFSFMVQVRPCSDELDIENASSEWNESEFRFYEVAKITIPAQQNDAFTAQQLERCERLEYTPWHSLTAHKPIGSINRLRKSVYQASADHRNRSAQNKSVLWAVIPAAILIIVLMLLGGCDNSSTQTPPTDPVVPPKPANEVIFLDQGFSNNDRLAFYNLTQGSQLLPYSWFLALETSDDQSLFRSGENMRALGYIPQQKDPGMNPDGLPIGYAKNDDPATVSYELKKEFLGPDYDVSQYPLTNAWLGVTCANCHTSEISYQGQTLRIDGGSSQADHQAFLEQLVAAIQATSSSPEKMTRFAHRVLDPNWSQGEQNALQQRVEAYTPVLERLTKQNKTELVYGPGRLDAFGAIFNRVLETGLEIPSNHFPSDAPVSYPFLWDTTRLVWVQYNSLGGSPIARNIGEVLGVYAHLQLKGTPVTGQFNSTANIHNLDRLEGYVSQLKAPVWPAKVLGNIDSQKASVGQQLYAKNCVQCHVGRDEQGNFPMVTDDKSGTQFIKTTTNTFLPELGPDPSKILLGTDPKMVLNAVAHNADPGAMKPYLMPEELQKLDQVPRLAILQAAVRGAIKRKLSETGIQGEALQELVFRLNGQRIALLSPPREILKTYRARPLDGIWATAPYLHNGSVPNLYQLLLPAVQRVTTFKVGSDQFDPVNVGFVTDQGFEFNTALLGNLNRGHSGPQFTQTQAEDGAYRDFTEDERMALVEYMKTLN